MTARWIDRAYDALLCRMGQREAYELRQQGYLRDHGWFRSFEEGEPIPWMNYGIVDFLRDRVAPSWNVFEYGSGASTLWWAKRVASVTACEHDPAWIDRMRPCYLANVRVIHVPFEYDGAYCRAILAEAGRFDLVVVDGRDRVRCALQSVPKLTESGVLILDDHERDSYAEADRELAAVGFRCLAFTGMKPKAYESSRAAIYYRSSANVLGL